LADEHSAQLGDIEDCFNYFKAYDPRSWNPSISSIGSTPTKSSLSQSYRDAF